MTFKITRESVIRAASQGLSASAIVARLKKHASVDVPENVLREVPNGPAGSAWSTSGQVTVVRCPDAETVARVVAALGKKAERLGETLVALHVAKLDDRRAAEAPGAGHPRHQGRHHPHRPEPSPTPEEAPAKKKRGRPKKVR